LDGVFWQFYIYFINMRPTPYILLEDFQNAPRELTQVQIFHGGILGNYVVGSSILPQNIYMIITFFVSWLFWWVVVMVLWGLHKKFRKVLTKSKAK